VKRPSGPEAAGEVACEAEREQRGGEGEERFHAGSLGADGSPV
jgi:hypothetical protein